MSNALRDPRNEPTDQLGSVGKLADGRSFVYFERRLPYSVEQVWSAITAPAELAVWFPGLSVELREGEIVWYAPDQSYDRKGAAVIPFFGVPAMHTTATSTLARLGNAVTLPYFPRRLDDGSYVHTILPPLKDFPGDDPVEDTHKYVRVLEAHIRSCPEQYFWIHRKFKNLPDGYDDRYADLDSLK